jgi:hypothetical protein
VVTCIGHRWLRIEARSIFLCSYFCRTKASVSLHLCVWLPISWAWNTTCAAPRSLLKRRLLNSPTLRYDILNYYVQTVCIKIVSGSCCCQLYLPYLAIFWVRQLGWLHVVFCAFIYKCQVLDMCYIYHFSCLNFYLMLDIVTWYVNRPITTLKYAEQIFQSDFQSVIQ